MLRRPTTTVSPVSSPTSRTAACSECSPGSSLPLGRDQSSYFGRRTTAVSSDPSAADRQTAPPAASTSSAGLLTGLPHQVEVEVALAARRPRAVGMQLPAADVRCHGGVEEGLQVLAGRLVADLEQHLDAAVEVAVHEVGAADPPLRLAAVGECHDPGVLQEAAHDRADADVLRQAVDARPQRADAADQQLDRDAGVRRLVQRVDDPLVDQGVHLEPDAAGPALGGVPDLAADL